MTFSKTTFRRTTLIIIEFMSLITVTPVIKLLTAVTY
jgi:hypothetical protein